ncbi:hypothetical protein ACFL20_02825 [Spirochaetota bacterium]
MLPVVDYGSIAIIIPKVCAVSGILEDEGKFAFEVFLNGIEEPIVIGFDEKKEAEDSRNELVAIIAQYHYTVEFGPDFDIDDIVDDLDEEDIDGSDFDNGSNKEH